VLHPVIAAPSEIALALEFPRGAAAVVKSVAAVEEVFVGAGDSTTLAGGKML